MLSYTVEQPLRIPARAFDHAGIARVNLAGGSYAGAWAYCAWAMRKGLTEEEAAIGMMATERAPGQSEAANEAALDWATKSCAQAGLRVEVISQGADQCIAAVMLAIAQPSAPTSTPEPEAATVEVGRIKHRLLTYLGWQK